MKRLYYLLFFCHISFVAYPYYFKHIGMIDGLSQPCVMSIYQDELGRMWFGTEEGLCVFDGNRIISYKPSDLNDKPNYTNAHLLGNENFPVTGDGNGSLYFVSDDNLMRFDLYLERFETLIPTGVNTVDFFDNRLWVGKNDSVIIWDDVQKKSIPLLTTKGALVQRILVDSKGNVWVGTSNGLFHYSSSGRTELIIPDEDIYSLFEDSKKNLWAGTRENGMYLVNEKQEIQKFIHLKDNQNSLSNNHIRCFTEDQSGNILIGTFKGLNVYHPEKKEFSVYTTDDLPGGLLRSSIFSILKDRQGTIWVGTYYGGVHYFNQEMDVFAYYPANRKRDDCLSNPFVGKMVEDKDNNIWICTEGGGLNFFDRKTKKITHYLSSPETKSIAHDNLKGICYSPSREKLYVGTHTGGLSIVDSKKKSFLNIPEIRDETGTFCSNVVNQVALLNDRYLILLTRAGVFKMSLDSDRITTLFEDGENYRASVFLLDSKNNIWLILGDYITRVNLSDASDTTVYNRKDSMLGRFPILSAFEDRQGRLFFGTRGSGLFMLYPEQGRFVHFSVDQNLLLSDYCYEITQTLEGYIAVTGDKGISLLNPDNRTLRTVELKKALPLSGLNYGCGILACRNGEIFVGGVNGLATYYERDLHLAPEEYQLYFSSLWVNNEEVMPNAPDGILGKAIPFVDRVTFKHYQNNLKFTFTSNNYINTISETKREYKLSGFDTKWLTCYDNKVSYTNLDPGKYTLYVREIHPSIHQETNTISIDIEIKAPLYATTEAYLFYLFLVISGLCLFLRIKQSRLLLRASLEYERKENIRIEEINKEKLQFFSNISHEFRTPLTLIISHVELLMQNRKLPPAVYNKLVKVHKNSSQMRTLITELLDFRKLEQGYSKLHLSEMDLVAFVREIYLSFSEMAAKENLNYQFTFSATTILCWFDPVQMRKVVVNLLSNAFKFTKPQGSIEILFEETDDCVLLKVIDNGSGIDENELQNIFNRFYQGSNVTSKEKQTIGSGLGLALAKTIVELHHGEITAESKPGYGSIFIVKLLKGNAHFNADELAGNPQATDKILPPVQSDGNVEERQEEDAPSEAERLEMYSILIIEDNQELLQVLSSLFEPCCRVILATNGSEGIKLARKEMPDIILSDIMMPEMSGTEMCSRLKNDIEICHIPVVLLTALDSPEQNIEGLSRGAEAYISKPFDSRVLQARCNSIVRNRILLRNKLSQQESFDSAALVTNPIDQKFLDNVQKLISENLSDEAFDINKMAKQIGLSRSSFYAKFKSLTGMTPNDFVLDYKLKQSVSLLEKNPKMQISELSTNLGFGSARYFSRCFKARYGSSPAKFKVSRSS